MNGYRLIEGFTEHAFTPGGPVAYFGNLRTWDHVLKDTLYATQEILGNAAAVGKHTFPPAIRLIHRRYTVVISCGAKIGG